MLDVRPQGYRIGQTMYDFLEFLRNEKGYASEAKGCYMADPYYIPDDKLKTFYAEFLAYSDRMNEMT